MKIKALLFFVILGFISFSTFAQNLNTTIQKSFGGTNDDFLYDIHKAPDGSGYYFIGTSNSDISGDKTQNSRGGQDAWLVKTDLSLNILWDKTIGGSGTDRVFSSLIIDNKIYILMDGNSPVSGDKTTLNYGAFDNWLVCCDLSGSILWQAQYGGANDDGAGQMTNKTDSSLMIVSLSKSGISGNKATPNYGFNDFWLIEISKLDGHIIQENNVGSNGGESACRIAVNQNNGKVFVAGYSFTGVSFDKTDMGYGLDDIWLVEMDESLNILSNKCFGGSSGELDCGIFIDDNDEVILSITSFSGVSGNKTTANYGQVNTSSDLWIVRLSPSLNIVWQKNYGGIARETGFITGKNVNGNYIVSARSTSIPSGNKTSPNYDNLDDVWLIIIDGLGNIIAQETYGGTNYDIPIVYQDPYSTTGLIFAGGSLSNVSGNKTVVSNGGTDSWIAKIDASNFLSTESLSANSSTISVYPNPFLESVNFEFEDLQEEVHLTVFSVDGKLVFEKNITSGNQMVEFSSDAPNQVYFYQIVGETINKTGKVLKN
jgi:hypothetical protein